MPMSGESFPTDPSGLPEAARPALLEPAGGDGLRLRIGQAAKRLGCAMVWMLAYNGSIPGPALKVRQGSGVVVHVVNEGDLEAIVHWHGLRLENKYDGVPHETQTPILVGDSPMSARDGPTLATSQQPDAAARSTASEARKNLSADMPLAPQ
jgi:FtsP/CotA-like multicopper oxidase with cupredoxin domain